MKIDDFIGKKQDYVALELKKIGFNIEIIENNFKVDGDTNLVTNIKIQGKDAKIYVGHFIFAVKIKG